MPDTILRSIAIYKQTRGRWFYYIYLHHQPAVGRTRLISTHIFNCVCLEYSSHYLSYTTCMLSNNHFRFKHKKSPSKVSCIREVGVNWSSRVLWDNNDDDDDMMIWWWLLAMRVSTRDTWILDCLTFALHVNIIFWSDSIQWFVIKQSPINILL